MIARSRIGSTLGRCCLTGVLTAGAVLIASPSRAAELTFDDIVQGVTTYLYDGDNDGAYDVTFTTPDPSGFNSVGPGPNMTYIQEPGIEGASQVAGNDHTLRADFPYGAVGELHFGFALSESTETFGVEFKAYDAAGNQVALYDDNGTQLPATGVTVLATFTTCPSVVVAPLTCTPDARSSFPEGRLSAHFAGVVDHVTLNFSNQARYILDNFGGTFGSGEVINPQCADGTMNGDETDIDCGGSCNACANGDDCLAAGDCLSHLCTDNVCADSHCLNGTKDSDETDVDCGGALCSPCGPDMICNGPEDCLSGLCPDGFCSTPACDDGVANGGETDVDCGGATCTALEVPALCDDGQHCDLDRDCASGTCVDGVCGPAQAPTCADLKQNGDETDVDCGGPDCGGCQGDQHCNMDKDCASGSCVDGVCAFVIAIDNSDGTTPYHVGGNAVVVDDAVTITGAGFIGGATVVINGGFADGDVLAAAAHDTISSSYDSGTGVLTLSGNATVAAYQALLRTVTFENTNGDSASTTNRVITFTLGQNGLYLSATGHFYQYVAYTGTADRSWFTAKEIAGTMRYFGLQGYLVTVSSALENSFVEQKITGQGWMGASDAGTGDVDEGVWRWVTGPEGLEEGGLGRHFFTQPNGGDGGVAVGGYYNNWAGGEPNDWGDGEDVAHFYVGGSWNDYAFNNPNIEGYVVEYGGMPGDPVAQLSDSKTVVVETCADKTQNGNETDVDCGGGICGRCDGDHHCESDKDCLSGTCLDGICTFIVSIDNSDGTTMYHQGGLAVVVDPNVVITGGGTLDGATVVINQGFASGQDVLAVTTSNGVTASYDANTGVLKLSGTATTVQYQAMLRTVTYRNTNTLNPSVNKRVATFTLGRNSLFFAANGHFYEYVSYGAGDDRTWKTAAKLASSKHYFGLQGYLVTVSDGAENAFVQSKITGQGWMGASDADVEGTWRWVTGPEGMENDFSGRYFFQQTEGGSGGTAIDGFYNNWSGGEPNQAGNEDYAHFYTNGTWNDYETTNGSIQGYVIEFGGMPGDAEVAISDSKPISIQTCLDNTQNGDETDIDCGGATCGKCQIAQDCALGRDCVTGVCSGGTCQAPTCTDKVQNGRETGVDCGSGCPGCGTGEDCNVPSDCASGVCTNGICAAPTCADKVKNGTETGIDCGGSCQQDCAVGDGCNVAGDCVSGVCTNHVCAAPTCTDGVRNGTESDTDCGAGACKACVPGDDCGVAGDCNSSVCTNHVCAAPTCTDGVRNGDESDKDCGGSCGDCKVGDHCGVAEDCDSGVCPITHVCAAPTCFDGVKNGTETARDCGGTCGPCNVGDGCGVGADCSSGVCKNKSCQAAVCGDGVIQEGETCDDGDLVTVTIPTIDGDGCSHVCLVEPGWTCDPSKEAEGPNVAGPSVCSEICGDASVVGSEGCDDGNTTEGDGCDKDCVVEAGWSCPKEGGECAPVCGDGKFQVGAEGCDDGNKTEGDGCSPTCTVEPGWSCAVDLNGGTTCSGGCGDGRVGATEGCDDGGAVAGDGCSATCQIEAGWDCTGTVDSVCTDDKDHDGVKTADDNCPEVANATQTDTDGDKAGDACDTDDDDDGVADATDNCALEANADQLDTDKDGKGDACDTDPDQDGDGADNFLDNCPAVANADQADDDNDGVGNACDEDYVAFKASGNGCATGDAGGEAMMWLGLASVALVVRGRRKREI